MKCAGQSTALAGFRAFLFYSWTLLLSVPLFVIMLVQAPFTLLFDKVRWAIGIVRRVWRRACGSSYSISVPVLLVLMVLF